MSRFFIAINLPNEIRNKLADLQNQLAEFDLPIRWAKPKNIHLTLVFLGEIKKERVDKVVRACKSMKDYERFKLSVKNLGFFPNFKNPRVIWIGIENGENLINLQKELANKLIEERFEIEKREFSPHLTLGRTKKRIKNFEGLITKLDSVDLGNFEVKSIEIMESKLTPEGPKYRLIKNIQLT